MVDLVDPNVFETANAGFAQAMYEEFLRDPMAVGPDWRRLFESGIVGEMPDGRNGSPAVGSSATSMPYRHTIVPSAVPSTPPVVPPSRPLASLGAGPTELPAGSIPIKGPAAKLVANMSESLTVPTATSFRAVPVGLLEERRRHFNQALQRAGRPSKISFTHLI